MSAAPAASLPAGVHVLERGWLSSNNVLLAGPDETALVDSGYGTHAHQTLALVENLLDARTLDRLANTHLHSDHCGGNAALQKRYPAVRTAIPPGGSEAVRAWDQSKLSYQATGQICPRFQFDELLLPGTSVALGGLVWQVHAAPGHDPDAVLLFAPSERLLISGDALWERGFGIVFPEMWGEPSFGDVAATLDVIETLDPARVIPGHGRVFRDVTGALAAARERLAAFVRNPERHARHAVKVLIKFKLLEQRRMDRTQFDAWLETASYLELVRQRFAAGHTLAEWTQPLLMELVSAGALRLEGNQVLDGD